MENHFNCIYMYENKINGKIYIGQAINFNKRPVKWAYGYIWKFKNEINN